MLLGVVAAAALQLPLEPHLRGAAPYAFYYIPVLASAWYGTTGSAIFAILASLLLSLVVSQGESEGPRGASGVAAALLFLGVSGGVSALLRVLRGNREERVDVLSRSRLAAIVESSDDAIVSKNLDGFIQSWNRGAERLFGHTAGEVVGKSITLIIPPELHTEEAAILERLRRGERVDHFETVRVARDGRRVDVSLSISPLFDRRGRIIGASKIARDVTGQRRLEAERRNAAHERERLLESERAARSEAERANRVKDEFVATLSHELRTPLNAVLGWTELLRRTGDKPETLARGLEVIERNTKLQAQLVSDLLDVSRIVSGKLMLELREMSLAAAIASAVETVAPLARSKGVELSTRLQGDLPPIAGDPARLQQVVWNLLLNAIKFTPEGGRIRLTLDLVDGEARLVVADTGIGIRPEFLGSLFERFRQADPSASRRHGGLGLGLAIVKHLVEEHGGTISAASEGEGRGATFLVRLPIASRLTPREAAPDTGVEGRASVVPEARLSGVRVLLVEDDADTRELLERLLRECGARVTAVASGAEALEALGRSAPDILVSDIGLPGMDGCELIRRVRALPPTRNGVIPAIAVTAFARPEDRARVLLAGYQAHVAKPVDAAELTASLANLLALSKPCASAH